MRDKIEWLVVAMAFCLMVLISERAFGATVEASFSPAATAERQVCVLTSDAPDIAGRLAAGTLGSAFGQCTTADGQDKVLVANITPGKQWYFVAVYRDPAAHGMIGDFTGELALDVPVNVLEVVPLPAIVLDGQEINMTITISK